MNATVAETAVDPSPKWTETQPLRLDRSTLWLPTLEAVRRVLVPALIGCFIAGPWVVVPGVLLCFVLPALVYYAVQYLTLSFWMTSEELVIESGWISRRERRIPWNRIQETELQQGLLRRPLRVVKLTLKTAGSDSEEAALDVITLSQAEAIRSAVVVRQHGSAAATDAGDDQDSDFECRLSTRDLVLGGLTSNLVTGLFAIVGALFYFQVFMRDGVDWFSFAGIDEESMPRGPSIPAIDRLVTRFQEQLPSFGPLDPIVDVIFSETLIKSLAVAFGGLVLSVGGFVIRYHGFRVRRHDHRLSIRWGLLTVNESSLSRRRIQSLKLDEGLLRRWFGLASIYVDSAGDRESVDENKKREVLLPVAPRSVAISVASQAIPDIPVLSPPWKRVSRQAIERGTKKGCLIVAVAVSQAAIWSPWLALALLPGFVVVYALNLAWYRNLGFWVGDDHLLFRRGWLNRSTVCLPIANIQNVVLSQTPFDRRRRLATLTIDTAGQSNTGGGPVIKNLPLRTAAKMQRELAHEVAAKPFAW